MFADAREHSAVMQASQNETAERLTVRIERIQVAAEGILSLELRPVTGAQLPAFTAGAHVDVLLPSGLVRQYSICNDPIERERYVLAVGKAPDSRGGSVEVHRLTAGTCIEISAPRNLFPLADAAAPVLFIAGGIGVTPIRAMICEAQRRGLQWQLLYAARSAAAAAFAEEFLDRWADRVTTFFAPEPQVTGGALWRRISEAPADCEIYCCGPAGLMDLVRVAASGRPAEKVHFESFGAPPPRVDDGSFDIRLEDSAEVYRIPPDKTIIEVLRDNGIDCVSACESGICGACESQVIEGVPDHRDSYLTQEQRQSGRCITICVSRALSPNLVLRVPR